MILSKKFSLIIVYFVYILVFSILFSIYIYLVSIKENIDTKDSVQRQINNDSIYNVDNMNMFNYKKELVKNIKPKIISLGSSRVMQFREESFNTKFITAGGAMNHLNEGYLFLQEITKYHKPEIIILGLDFWWFNENYYQPNSFSNSDIEEVNIKNKINITQLSQIKPNCFLV